MVFQGLSANSTPYLSTKRTPQILLGRDLMKPLEAVSSSGPSTDPIPFLSPYLSTKRTPSIPLGRALFMRPLVAVSSRWTPGLEMMLPLRALQSRSNTKSSADDDLCVCGEAIRLDLHTDSSSAVARIMKIALPDNAKIAKEAKECMQECVSEFISFITSEGMR